MNWDFIAQVYFCSTVVYAIVDTQSTRYGIQKQQQNKNTEKNGNTTHESKVCESASDRFGLLCKCW